jgi:ABC-2 type transport system ATP-binding protein
MLGNQEMAILKVNEISKSYGDFQAVDQISFAVQPGRIYGVLGPNGAGKTTTIRMVMNILVPDSGTIHLFDEHMSEELKQRIGYLPEERGLYTKMKVIDMLVFLGELRGMGHKLAVGKSEELLREFELHDWQTKKVEELSKGMQQKVQFIGTIMHDPDLIILDEPFSGLDPINAQLIKDIMVRLRQNGKAIMFSTHVMEAAEKLCDDILLINEGKKVLDGPLAEIKKKFSSNSIQIEYTGDESQLKGLKEVDKINNYGNYVELQLSKDSNPQRLLKLLVDKVEIHRFQTAESSLNDIFIDIVGSRNDA